MPLVAVYCDHVGEFGFLRFLAGWEKFWFGGNVRTYFTEKYFPDFSQTPKIFKMFLAGNNLKKMTLISK
jgi:hypothetical protein